MNRIQILLFATLRDTLGTRRLQLDLPAEATVAGLKDLLVATYPQLSPSRNSIMVAVNQEYAGDDSPIPSGAEIALFPPVSGG
ncbi:MAG TPA: molybdopterin converting factor subunit 1 [Anaerolineales bacterium]|nr:molybdopterin converting factor subunit 1 [Anaerolineales bacterium]